MSLEMAKLIERADKHYHAGSSPIMSDAEYDKLKDELRLKDPRKCRAEEGRPPER